MTRLLTSEEIEYMLDFIVPQKGVPHASAMSICEHNKERFRVQLKGEMVYPEIIEELKSMMEKEYFSSLVHPGEAVGVICAQSIGEKNTQTALNTFHKAGQSEKTMTEGVPRFQELLNATRNQKRVNHKIFFNKGNSDVKSLRATVGSSIAGLTLGDLTLKTKIFKDKADERWYEPFQILNGHCIFELKSCVRVWLNTKKLFEFKITEQNVSEKIESAYDDIFCIVNPMECGVIDIFVNTNNVVELLDDKNIAFVNPENAIEVYLEDVVEPNMEKVEICGIQSVDEIFYVKENGEWILETNATNSDPLKCNNLRTIMSLPHVDQDKTTSNNIWEIYETLGIAATKEFLVEEFMNIMDGINECHARLLVDRMTFNGGIASISRYTLKNDECGPMGKASFEESLDNFLNAAAEGEVEPTRGISASIICGKRSHTGTGIMGLKMDLSALN